MKPGDLLVELHDQAIDDLDSAHNAIARIRPGDKVILALKRGDQTLELTLTASEGF